MRIFLLIKLFLPCFVLFKGIKQDAIDLMLGNYRPDPSGPSPFTPASGQESLSNNVTKVFVLLMIVFSSSLILSPYTKHLFLGPSSGFSSLKLSSTDNLGASLLLSIVVTLFVVIYIMYNVVKVGSKIGRKIVIHPQLIPEPLPSTN